MKKNARVIELTHAVGRITPQNQDEGHRHVKTTKSKNFLALKSECREVRTTQLQINVRLTELGKNIK
jgi:hypothetical protein